MVQYSNPNFPEPFPVLIDEFQMRSDIDEEVAERKAATLEQLSYEPLEEPAARAAKFNEPQAGIAAPLLSKPVQDYLVEVAKDQFLPASRRDQDQGIPLSQGNALRKELVDAGLICLERVNTYSKARKILNTRLTQRAYDLLKSMKIPVEKPKGKGGWEHVYHQHSIARWGVLAGYRVAIEYAPDGKSVDVCLEGETERIAVEILCHGIEKELNNLRDLYSGYSEIWFCVKDAEEMKRLRELISLKLGEESTQILMRVKFKLLGQFQDALALQQRPRVGP